ncbi:MAG: nuclear transport factor 2 family protein [Erysipelotrichaceae bacterium]|nr:nuclear transport factor 2 family protein [Erysipelotrichaceae bacterium]
MNTERFWKDILEQNEKALPDYFHPDAVIRWHCTNEKFTVNEFICANCEYPGSWDGEIERIESLGSKLITAINVYPRDRSASFHVVSFFELKDGLIMSLDEYWSDDGEAPSWRKEMGVGKPIR